MKKLTISIVFLLMSTILFAQREYARSSFSLETGFTKLENVSQVTYANWHVDYRFMLNTKLGVKAGVGYTDYYDSYIRELGLQAVFNMGRIFELENVLPNFTVLTFGGMAITDSNGQTNNFIIHRNTHFNPILGFQLEQKITKGLFFGIGGNVMPGINDRPDVSGGGTNGSTATTNKWEFNAFVTVPILRGKEEHADYYVNSKNENKLYIIDRTITEKPINNYHVTVVDDTDNKPIEYVYFKHDNYNIDKDALANIEKSFRFISKDDEVLIVGYCSNVGSVEYNKILALKRANAVKDKLVALGIDSDKIITEAKGIDLERGKLIYDLSRRVTIEIKQ